MAWGFLILPREKVEALVQEMEQRGEITQQESPEAVKQILAKAQDAQQSLLAKVKELTTNAIAEMKLARSADLHALEKRLAALEEEVELLKGFSEKE